MHDTWQQPPLYHGLVISTNPVLHSGRLPSKSIYTMWFLLCFCPQVSTEEMSKRDECKQAQIPSCLLLQVQAAKPHWWGENMAVYFISLCEVCLETPGTGWMTHLGGKKKTKSKISNIGAERWSGSFWEILDVFCVFFLQQQCKIARLKKSSETCLLHSQFMSFFYSWKSWREQERRNCFVLVYKS